MNYGFVKEYITCDDAELYEFVSKIFRFQKYFDTPEEIIEDSKKTFYEVNSWHCYNYEVKKHELISNSEYVKIYQEMKISLDRNAIRVDYEWIK